MRAKRGGVFRFVTAALALLLALSAGAAAELNAASAYFDQPEMRIGVSQGSASMDQAEAALPKAQIRNFNATEDGYMALGQGKLDAYVYDGAEMEFAAHELDGLTILSEYPLGSYNISVGVSKKRADLIGPIDDAIAQLRADGTLADMNRRWVVEASAEMPDIPAPENPAGKLVVGTSGIVVPMTYYGEGGLTGHDIELGKRLSRMLNLTFEWTVADYGALLAGCETGIIDIVVADLNYTPERAEAINFSEPYRVGESVLLTQDETARQIRASDENATLDISFLAGEDVAILTGTTFDALVGEKCPAANRVYFSGMADGLNAVRLGKARAFVADEPTAREVAAGAEELGYVHKIIQPDHYAFALDRESEALCQAVSDEIEAMAASGELEALKNKWFGTAEAERTMEPIPKTGEKGVVRFATDSATPPFAYVRDGETVGYDIDVLARACERQGYGLEICTMDFGAIIPALTSGKCEMGGGCMSVTAERKKSVLFTTPNYEGGVVLIMRKSEADALNELLASGETVLSLAGLTGEASRDEPEDFWTNLKNSFVKNFITENRYELILEGLWVTVLISVLSDLLGTVLGFGVCMARRSKYAFARVPARALIRLMQGMPIVVFLMILYFVVFAASAIDAIWVAVIGFSINFAAYVSEMMRTGIEAVDKGQIEAAGALGYSRARTFWVITFPQAARHFLPVYKGEFISMVKMTSVVGYITIMDLTKMADIIRSRTYEAFFPLIATAVIYFALAYLLSLGLTAVERKLDPKRRARIVKGVQMQ